MRIAVVVPPIRDFYLSPHRMSALGARTVLRLCRARGHDAGLYVMPVIGKKKAIPLPAEADYLRPFLVPGERGPLSFFAELGRFGPDWDACAEIAAAGGPGLVLISSFAYAYAEDAALLGSAVRRRLPSAAIAVGGAGPSASPDYYLDAEADGAPVFDYVIAGEAETNLDLLFTRMKEDGMAGGPRAGTRKPARLLRSESPADYRDLDCVFSVVRETPTEAWAAVSLSRGCPAGCRFCSNFLCHGREFRTVPMEKVEKQAETLPAGKKIHLNFEDDNLLLDAPYFRRVLKFFADRFPGAGFSAENGLDYRLLTPRLLEDLAGLGFERFNLSLASIEGETAAREGRGFDVPRYLETARILERLRLPLVTYFIAGLDTDTPESVVRHLVFLAKAPTLVGISLFYPVPGLPGLDPPPAPLKARPGLARGSFAYPWTGALTTAELTTAFRLARFVNLTKKPNPDGTDRALVDRVLSTGRLHTLAGGRGGAEMVPAPADPNLEKLFFEAF